MTRQWATSTAARTRWRLGGARSLRVNKRGDGGLRRRGCACQLCCAWLSRHVPASTSVMGGAKVEAIAEESKRPSRFGACRPPRDCSSRACAWPDRACRPPVDPRRSRSSLRPPTRSHGIPPDPSRPRCSMPGSSFEGASSADSLDLTDVRCSGDRAQLARDYDVCPPHHLQRSAC